MPRLPAPLPVMPASGAYGCFAYVPCNVPQTPAVVRTAPLMVIWFPAALITHFAVFVFTLLYDEGGFTKPLPGLICVIVRVIVAVMREINGICNCVRPSAGLFQLALSSFSLDNKA